MKQIKKRLKSGETLIGCWLNLGSSVTAEIVGLSGFDWVLIDLEHGAGEPKDLLHQLQALEHTAAGAIVRVESYQKERIHRVLDLGAQGVMCPRINSAHEARTAVQGMHYPPKGIRGVAKMVRATGFGKDFNRYKANTWNELLGIIQIETLSALDDLDEIAATPGVDVLFIGPADLTVAMGIDGETSHPLFLEAVDRIVGAAKKASKAVGILIFDPQDFEKYQDLGIQLIACGSDATFVANGARDLHSKLSRFKKQTK
ncbi:4-hydroxy-2-oxoheptanedioate aldolase [Cyclobacterium lianum]|uniref:4-hydroxy-2-oxoheptanedioate aldolase n=1 Tax=Cyclobacterium lianum TaxID=388280 RepID=A0A1M7L5Y4_9BACT|nr:aldolase/citrate lyase family protein [Cyclobacterium lianum]SHM73527.1 4-hydroxy-2-oxoheptanedioate aldolase [Cyclobacterium lianum]